MADYATRLMHVLAKSEARLSATKVAELSSMPLATVSKILKLLSEAGLLSSTQGAKGGYLLANSPQKISLAKLVVAVDGPVALTSCVANEASCAYSAACDQQENWQTISQIVFNVLDQISLADMLGQVSQEKIDVLNFVPSKTTLLKSNITKLK